jgi:hypothetical protein
MSIHQQSKYAPCVVTKQSSTQGYGNRKPIEEVRRIERKQKEQAQRFKRKLRK